jgi:hypothetical protein
MGVLNDIKVRIDRVIEEKKLDGAVIRGKLALKTGFLLAIVNASTPDDPVKVAKLKSAAAEILNLKV